MPAVRLILLFCSIQYLFFFFFFLCLLLRKHYWCLFFKHKIKYTCSSSSLNSTLCTSSERSTSPRVWMDCMPEVSPETPNQVAFQVKDVRISVWTKWTLKGCAQHTSNVRKLPYCPTIWLRAQLPFYTQQLRVQIQLTIQFTEVQKFQAKPQADREIVISSPPASLWGVFTAFFVLFAFPN